MWSLLEKNDVNLRWRATGFIPPEEKWTSYDRTPWKHPWLNFNNISEFRSYSKGVMHWLSSKIEKKPTRGGKYAFIGNMANISFMRAAGLRRYGINIDVFLHPQDTSLMSQPFWEEYDGNILELGVAPEKKAFNAELPTHTYRSSINPNWEDDLKLIGSSYLTPIDVLHATEFMPFKPLLDMMQNHDALLVSQTFVLASLAKRPYLVAQSGGDIWFDPARGDILGLNTMRALKEAYAILVSNPITLAHARRYRLNNCIYIPFCIDDNRYHPGEEKDIRNDWTSKTGGSFFVLMSARVDNKWKGANIGLEGFARFASTAPGARLVVLSWGVDISEVESKFKDLGILEKVLILPIVGKRRLARYLRAADVMIEQFVLGYYGAAGLEGMASGLPIVMRLEHSQYDALVESGAPPVLNAADASEVDVCLQRLYKDVDFRNQVSRQIRSWFMDNHAASSNVDNYQTIMAAAAAQLPIDWSKSPLSLPLTHQEEAYHQNQMLTAPAFPSYDI